MPQATSKLRRIVLWIGAPTTIAVVAAMTVLAGRSTTAEIERAALRTPGRDHETGLGHRYAIPSVNAEMIFDFWPQTPSIVDGARDASDTVRSRGVGPNRRRGPGAATHQYPRARPGIAGPRETLVALQTLTAFAEIFFTEAHGINVASTNVTTDVVQIRRAVVARGVRQWRIPESATHGRIVWCFRYRTRRANLRH